MLTMFKNFVLIILILIASFVSTPSVAMASSCTFSGQDSLTANVNTQTLSAVSGSELALGINIKNNSKKDFNNGAVTLTITREPKAGDFAEGNAFVVYYSVVKNDLAVKAGGGQTLSHTWKIPNTLPSGLYRADVAILADGKILDTSSSVANSPFGNSAKVYVTGEKTGAAFFIAATNNNKTPNVVFVNNTKQAVTLPLTIKTYSGNVLGEMINSESKTLSTASGSSTVIELVAPESKSYSVVAETAYLGIPAFYVYSSDVVSDCMNVPIEYIALVVGILGAVLFIFIKRRKAVVVTAVAAIILFGTYGVSEVNAQSSTGNPTGTVDTLNCSYASGWSYDPTYQAAPVYGCTDSSANNYNASATADDGSCTYTPTTPVDPGPCVSRYRWINISGSAGSSGPAAQCASAGAASVGSYSIGICASGENRPKSGNGYASINYSAGTWGGGNNGGGDFIRDSGASKGGYYCYNNSIGQRRDEDVTDRAVAYLCDFGAQYPDSCPGDYPATGGGGGCFTSDTMITLADGTLKAVSELNPNDVVRGETQNNKVIEVKKVLLGNRPLYSINDSEGFVTAGHPFKTTEGWKSIDPVETAREGNDLVVTKLSVGDKIITEFGMEQVNSITGNYADPSMVLYNPMLGGDHTYYANQLLVHNKYMITDPSVDYLNFLPDPLQSFKKALSSLVKPLIVFAASGDSNSVLIYEGGTLLATVPANLSRPDVNAVFGISGNHGFSWTLPDSLKDGNSHTLRFYGTNTDSYGSDTELSNSPASVTCSPSTVPNSSPSNPTLSCPANGSFTNTSLNVSFSSSDSNGDQVRYHIDWDNNGTIDQIVPAGSFVPAGTQQSANRSWSTSGTKIITIMAEDSQGGFSNSSSCSFTLADSPVNPPVNPPVDPDGNGGNGGGNGGNGGNGTGNAADFSVSGDSKIGIQFLADLPSTSQSANISVNPVNGFSSPVTLSVQSIKSIGGADLAGVTPTYYWYGQESATAVMTYDSGLGMYRNSQGLVGTKFSVKLSGKITEKYYVTIVGTSGSMTATHVIELDPSTKTPVFQEI